MNSQDLPKAIPTSQAYPEVELPVGKYRNDAEKLRKMHRYYTMKVWWDYLRKKG